MEVIGLNLKINSEYEKILPKMKIEEYESLKQSIKARGLQYPIIHNSEGTILDGHNRYRICMELGIKDFKTEERNFDNKEAEKVFVIVVNLERRHLNDYQKSEMGMVLLKLEGEIAKQTLRMSPQLRGDSAKGEVTDIVSKKIGVSRGTFERAKNIIEKGKEDLQDAVREDEMSINAGNEIIKKSRYVEELIAAETPEVQERAYELVGDKLYSRDFKEDETVKKILDIVGGLQKLVTREFPIEKFSTIGEAQEWARARGGVCKGKIEKWLIEYDEYLDKKIGGY